MLRSKLILCTLALCFLFYSCSESEPETTLINVPSDLLTYTVNVASAKEISFNDVLEDVQFIALKVPDDKSLAHIRKVLISDEYIYVLDSIPNGNHNQISVFDLEGNFKFNINRPGNGPGEFTFIFDFSLTEDHVVIISYKHFLYYNRFNGEYVRSVYNFFDNESMQWVHMFDDHYAVSEMERGRANIKKEHLRLLDVKQRKILKSYIPFKFAAVNLGGSSRYLFQNEMGLRLRPVNSNLIFSIDKQADSLLVQPVYRVDFGDKWVTEEFLKTSFKNMSKIFSNWLHVKIIHSFDVYEDAQFLYLSYALENKDYAYLHDKRTGKSADVASFINNHIGWSITPLTTYKQWIVAEVDYEFVENNIDSVHPSLKKLVENPSSASQRIFTFARFSLK